MCNAQFKATHYCASHNAAAGRLADNPCRSAVSAACSLDRRHRYELRKGVNGVPIPQWRHLHTYANVSIIARTPSLAHGRTRHIHPGQVRWGRLCVCRRPGRRSTADRSRVLAFWSELLRVRREGHIACRQMQLASDVFVFVFFLVSLTVCRRRTRLRDDAAPGIPLIATWGHL